MWLLLAFLSAALLGFYDAFKKQALQRQCRASWFCFEYGIFSLIFLPFILVSCFAPAVLGGTMFDVPVVGWDVHKFHHQIFHRSFLVDIRIFRNEALPLTIVGPINATRRYGTCGTMLVFGEQLNLYQWIGVMLAVLSFFMLSRSGKKETSTSKHNKWILLLYWRPWRCCQRIIRRSIWWSSCRPMVAVMVQHLSGVYHVSQNPVVVVSQKEKYTVPLGLDYHRYIVFLCAADFVYFYALSYAGDSMISIVSAGTTR